MRLIDNSICSECELFEHECDVSCGDDDYCCQEYCRSSNNFVVDIFFDDDNPISKCISFKKLK